MDETYILVRKRDNGNLERIRFTRHILGRMDISEHEWKPLDLEADFEGSAPSGPPTKQAEGGET